MRQRRLAIWICVWVMMILGLGAGTRTWAAPIDPGFDLLRTPTQSTTLPGLAMASGGFITSDDVMNLHGVPVGPGTTDTIIQRHTGLGDGATGAITAEIVALHLRGTVLTQMGPMLLDIRLDPNQRSMGTINVTEHTMGGGLFTSFFDVFTELSLGPTTLTRRQDSLVSDATPWSHTPGPGYVDGGRKFPAGGFFITAAGISHQGPHPHVNYAIPEPSTLFLLGSGLVGLLGLSLRKKRSQKA